MSTPFKHSAYFPKISSQLSDQNTIKRLTVIKRQKTIGEGEGEVAFFSAKRWDRRSRTDLIESATPCHDAQVVGPYRDSNPLHLTILAAMSEDYTTAPQHLQ